MFHGATLGSMALAVCCMCHCATQWHVRNRIDTIKIEYFGEMGNYTGARRNQIRINDSPTTSGRLRFGSTQLFLQSQFTIMRGQLISLNILLPSNGALFFGRSNAYGCSQHICWGNRHSYSVCVGLIAIVCIVRASNFEGAIFRMYANHIRRAWAVSTCGVFLIVPHVPMTGCVHECVSYISVTIRSPSLRQHSGLPRVSSSFRISNFFRFDSNFNLNRYASCCFLFSAFITHLPLF